MTHRRVSMLVMAVWLAGPATSALPETIALKTCDAYRLDYETDTGRLALCAPDGTAILSDVSSVVEVRRGRRRATVRAPKPVGSPAPERRSFKDALGRGECVLLPAWNDPDGTFSVRGSVRLYEGEAFFVLGAKLTATGKEPVALARLIPLETSSGVNLDADPRQIWCIENGNGLFLDFYVRRLPASRSVKSNGDVLLYAPGTDRGLALGFLTHNLGRTTFRSEVASSEPPTIERFAAECVYDPVKSVAPGESVEAEGGVSVALTRGQPLEAAERWASCVATAAGRPPFDRRQLVKWNPWAARYKQGIDEAAMLAEMDAAAKKLLPYGMRTFHIDAGWEKAWGDWEANEGFPRGMKVLADRMHELGFRRSIWLAPFAANTRSALAAEHRPWFLPKGPLARGLMGRDQIALDLTKPDVKAWLGRLFARLADDWQFECFKLDFLYYASACAPFSDRSKTTQQAHREALGVIRQAIGKERLLYPVGVPIVSNVGYADVIRIGLDNKPIWNKARGPHDQGIRTSVRTLARRYYLNRRLWINHPDTLFTGDAKTAKRWDAPPLSLEEARAWHSLVGLAGGVICIGDSLVDLTGQRLDMVRRIMPTAGEVARPLDLFEHRFPEVWNLKIVRDFETWNVVGVFHWGDNDRWGEPMPDAPRTVRVAFANLGLDANRAYAVHEFWQDRHVGTKRGGVDVRLEPHSCQVFSIRQVRDRPHLIATNRHISQGGVEIRAMRWDAGRRTLSCTQRLVGGWPYAIALRVPQGFAPRQPVRVRTAGGASLADVRLEHKRGELWRLAFTSPRCDDATTWTIEFARAGASR